MTDSDHTEVVPFLLAACPPELLEDLAVRVDEEGQALLDAALQGELPTAFVLAGYRRRRAAVWARLAEERPEFTTQAAKEREAWLRAEARHTQEAVLRSREG